MGGNAGCVGMAGDCYSVPATAVQNSSHLGASVTFTMPFTFSSEEYADMIYVYGFCDGNSVLAIAEYQQRFPNRRIPNRRVFTGVYQALRDTGRLPGVRIAAQRGVNEGVNEEGIVRMVHCSPRTRREELQDVFMFPTRECGEHCMQRACIHTTCSECTSPTWRFC